MHYARWKRHGTPELLIPGVDYFPRYRGGIKGRKWKQLPPTCKKGHPFEDGNIVIRSDDGWRRCRECMQAADRRRYLKHHDRLLEASGRRVKARYWSDESVRQTMIERS